MWEWVGRVLSSSLLVGIHIRGVALDISFPLSIKVFFPLTRGKMVVALPPATGRWVGVYPRGIRGSKLGVPSLLLPMGVPSTTTQ